LSVFPEQVLFQKSLIKNRRSIRARACYEADLWSFKPVGQSLTLRYRNRYDCDNQLIIAFAPADGVYRAEKLIKGQSVLDCRGVGWSTFFAQLTMFGLVPGEGVWFALGEESGNL